MDVLDVHQRSCEQYEKWLRAQQVGGGGGTPGVDENGFVPCKFCGRTFFPDRLKKHLPVCPKKKDDDGALCRETMVDGQSLTRGSYE